VTLETWNGVNPVKYIPNPVDTSRIELSEELLQLTERLAENSHENWAMQRRGEGWTYGPERDDARKTHPDLLPYSELPEAEREYDRRIVKETIKAILALGYRVVK
jgi:ryanodine receptor 2